MSTFGPKIEEMRHAPRSPPTGLTFFPAPKDLADWVACLWRLDSAAPAGPEGSSQRVLPDGFPELIVHLRSPYLRYQGGRLDRDPRAFVFGQLSEAIELRSRHSVLAVGARLQPAALAQLTSLPGHEFYGGPVSLNDLWGAGGRRLEQRLRASPNATRALDLLVRALRELRRSRSLYPGQQVAARAATWIQKSRGCVSIHDLSHHLGCSRRHLERVFHENLGISPKRFARLQRFQALQRTIAAAPQPQWLTLALQAGYSDQAHMIREFREFSGQTPGDFANSHHALATAFVVGPAPAFRRWSSGLPARDR